MADWDVNIFWLFPFVDVIIPPVVTAPLNVAAPVEAMVSFGVPDIDKVTVEPSISVGKYVDVNLLKVKKVLINYNIISLNFEIL